MSEMLNMEYNSQKETLVIPEYGRNVQLLIEYARRIEDDEYRQAFVEQVVRLMHQMSPQSKSFEDYKEKLWKHVFRIADYDLDVTPPNGIIPTEDEKYKRPEQLGYPKIDTRFRHYGNNVQKLIKKAIGMEEGPIRDGFVATIANYMKLAYQTWNKEHYISDEIILNDLKILSKGQLVVKDNASLDNLSNSNRRRKSRSNNNNNSNKTGGKRNNNNNTNNNYRRKR